MGAGSAVSSATRQALVTALASGGYGEANEIIALLQATYTGNPPVNVTSATVTLAPATHAGRVVTLNRAAGVAVTLPAATGTGNQYIVQIGTTVTSNTTTITTGVTGSSCDCYEGQAQQTGAAGAVTSFKTAAAGASGSDVITLNGTTTGGIQGDFVYLTDIATGVWMVELVGSITGTAATPFSHT